MKVKNLGTNQTEIEIGSFHVLLSYETPVACYDAIEDKYFVTNQFHSKTTSRHINKWINPCRVEQIAQSTLDTLLDDNGVTR